MRQTVNPLETEENQDYYRRHLLLRLCDKKYMGNYFPLMEYPFAIIPIRRISSFASATPREEWFARYTSGTGSIRTGFMWSGCVVLRLVRMS